MLCFRGSAHAPPAPVRPRARALRRSPTRRRTARAPLPPSAIWCSCRAPPALTCRAIWFLPLSRALCLATLLSSATPPALPASAASAACPTCAAPARSRAYPRRPARHDQADTEAETQPLPSSSFWPSDAALPPAPPTRTCAALPKMRLPLPLPAPPPRRRPDLAHRQRPAAQDRRPAAPAREAGAAILPQRPRAAAAPPRHLPGADRLDPQARPHQRDRVGQARLGLPGQGAPALHAVQPRGRGEAAPG